MAGKTKPRFDSRTRNQTPIRQAKQEMLSAIQLKTLKPGKHYDGGGLYLNVELSGSRSWILRTVVRGKRRELGLGGLATTSLAEARKEAADLRKRARKGENILEARRIEKKIIPTFKQAANTYHGVLKETFTSETHAYNWMQSLESYVFPVFGSKTVDAIDTADVLKAIGPIWNTVPDTARRTLRRIKAIFEYCQASGYRNVMMGSVAIPLPNPCDGMKTALPNNRTGEKHHEAIPYAELPQFIQDLRKVNAALSIKLGLEFLVLTAMRTSEVLFAKWDEIDFDANTWTVPGRRDEDIPGMKMQSPHKVPLSDRCIEILKLAKEFNDAEIIFPGRNPGEPLSNMAFLMCIRRMGRETLTVHGARATFKTWAEETTKFDSLVIEACLAHEVKGIERHYLRTAFFDQRRKLMSAWAEFATGEKMKAKVVKIRG
jgi:integrase